MRTGFWTLALAAVSLAAVSPWASAQGTFPTHTVKLVVPYSAGAGTDLLARRIAEKLGPRLGQSVIVENIAGASSAIGSAAVARAEPDGHTMLINGGITHFSPYLRTNSVGYDPYKSFTALIYVADTPLGLVVRSAFPAKNIAEYVDYAKKHPGEVTFGSPGPGTAQHIAMEQLRKETGIDIRHIPHRQLATVSQDILGGNLDSGLFVLGGALGWADGKNARIIAACGEKRCTATPEIPSFKEGGVDCSGCSSASALLLLPTGTPDQIGQKLNAEINVVMQDPEFRRGAESAGWIVRGGTVKEVADFFKSESDTWSRVMSDPALRIQ